MGHNGRAKFLVACIKVKRIPKDIANPAVSKGIHHAARNTSCCQHKTSSNPSSNFIKLIIDEISRPF